MSLSAELRQAFVGLRADGAAAVAVLQSLAFVL